MQIHDSTRYVEQGYLKDSLIIHTDPAVSPFFFDRSGAKIPDERLPHGFRQWRKFGAPPDAPGKVGRTKIIDALY